MTGLGNLGGGFSWALDINNSGQIVGAANTVNGRRHGFVYSDGRMTDLNTLIESSWTITSANGINDVGQIAADGCNTISGECHALLLSLAPVPEAQTYAMMLVGLWVVGIAVKRKDAMVCPEIREK